jgi:hypothetical protein
VDLRLRARPRSSDPDIQGATVLFSRGLRPHGFAVERSDNGGRAWTESLPARTRYGSGADGGRHWQLRSPTHVNRTPPGGLPFGCDKSGFAFATPSRGWAGGFCAGGSLFFLRTADGGRHWTEIHSVIARR